VVIAKTIDTSGLAGAVRLRDLQDLLRRKRARTNDPNEATGIDALIRELEAATPKAN
jgi:hypothetical protein